MDSLQQDGWTPLHRASLNGHKDVVELLLAMSKRTIMIVREQELEQQFRNDLERTLAERQQESDIDRHVRVICDEMLT
ncbi:hypothetical protein SARC_07297 [Sphaeroforma arctica JP610]|uniref:Uncharacterized protein n=1 Tax=Sphaeroforma arctica JP610 TaxID=667725 RepID=A0A0L0FUJ7_9EUKA|nr:hypothetical protein SARC_07297 [Sphaeroforma arctica JP610]KNC80339.1 hypothetical protein SARC_07297 [Sphaeroforma arctica JP610]|eukprot:XP_014154241.1 hypothetical protein SARC_07297 [Sphaeroforma arctica JP610]